MCEASCAVNASRFDLPISLYPLPDVEIPISWQTSSRQSLMLACLLARSLSLQGFLCLHNQYDGFTSRSLRSSFLLAAQDAGHSFYATQKH